MPARHRNLGLRLLPNVHGAGWRRAGSSAIHILLDVRVAFKAAQFHCAPASRSSGGEALAILADILNPEPPGGAYIGL